MIALSILIPVFNEADSVGELHHQLSHTLASLHRKYEIIFVDDGSTDDTPARLADLEAKDSTVKVLSFPRNQGKSAAYMAGFNCAQGEFIVTMDGDLQDDPEEISALLAAVEAGYDVVIGWKQGRFENEPGKKIPSFVFNRLASAAFGIHVHDANCGLRILRNTVAARLVLYGDLYRFIPQLSANLGFKVREIPVRHRKRKYSVSKYGFRRFWTGALDLISVRFLIGYREKPLQFFGTLAVFPSLAGVGLEFYVLLQKFSGSLFRDHLAALIIGVMLIIVAVQMLAIGLIGELLVAQHHHAQHAATLGKQKTAK
jgi:glycosyltransferase involved in cell wall biosynthesis